MSRKPKPVPAPDQTAPPAPAPDAAPEPGYGNWLKGEIAAGLEDIEAGNTTPAGEVWSELDIE